MSYYNQINRRKMNGPSAAVIRYEEGSAPTVVAQGKGALAAKILELAGQHGIPMEQDSSLLSELLDIDLGDSIPPQLYSVIAEMLILIEEMESTY
ncbi:EscU/YscU/HrcU family type III secretion system export apparatus switch protein [Domibacillus epiphyticus]|uniref:Flagellar biosynthesis protein FlhS n=1 Tax=Domibacillus epiphyticus TaxID=1714355 RepID=A0A1V2A476_9BACI|nr:EscU/YscU/HrcU family type III secretion system export apparatus switch protein [Domibacillus epiphyticus]OMP65809.1 flagellar biosynthesis protein FlhS [Domibacillus epiphyticus]